jgi:spore coat protein U-like protein
MNLGTYTGVRSTSGATNIRVTCTNSSQDYDIGLNAGTAIGASTSNRKMTGPASAMLNYGLFRDAAHTQNWGNTVGVDTAHGRGKVQPQDITVYPQIPAGQLVAPGTYVDTISTSSRSFTVTAVVPSMCQITATNMDFGTYTGVDLNAVSTLTVTCSHSTPYYVNLDNGLNPTGGWLTRARGPGGALLNYTLFREAARSSRWGNTYNFDGVGGTGSGSAQTLTVYGSVPAGQFVTPGTYADTVVATVTY